MTIELLSSGAMLIDDDLRRQAADVAGVAQNSVVSRVFIEIDDGRRVEVGADLSNFLVAILGRLSHGAVSVTTLPDELTTTVAAEMIGISRPTLMKVVAAGEISARKVGTHTRVATSDVLEYKRVRAERRAASFHALRVVDDEIGELPARITD